jgi:hypothetical protein
MMTQLPFNKHSPCDFSVWSGDRHEWTLWQARSGRGLALGVHWTSSLFSGMVKQKVKSIQKPRTEMGLFENWSDYSDYCDYNSGAFLV